MIHVPRKVIKLEMDQAAVIQGAKPSQMEVGEVTKMQRTRIVYQSMSTLSLSYGKTNQKTGNPKEGMVTRPTPNQEGGKMNKKSMKMNPGQTGGTHESTNEIIYSRIKV